MHMRNLKLRKLIRLPKVTQVMNNRTGFWYQVSVASSLPMWFSPLLPIHFPASQILLMWCCGLEYPTNLSFVCPNLTNSESSPKPSVSVKFLWCLQLIFLLRTSVVFIIYTTLSDVSIHYLILTTLYAFAFLPVCENLNF